MNLGTSESVNKKLNDLPIQYRFPTVQNLQSQINAVSRKIRTSQQILWNNGALTGAVCGCYVFGIDYTTGNLYYKDENNEWVLATNGGGGGMFDATVNFSVNADPNTVGTTFSPNTPALTTVLYVSTIDFSQWTYDGSQYNTYVSPFWTTSGNPSIGAGNFIGSINNAALKLRTNNIQRADISAAGVLTVVQDAVINLVNVGRGAGTNSNSTILGIGVLGLNTTGVINTGAGDLTLGVNTTGGNNCGFGYRTLNANTTGSFGCAFGVSALGTNISANNNSAFGFASLTLTTGAGNIGLGANSGKYNTTGANQIFINSIDRTNYANEQSRSPIYVQQNATVASQLITLNGKVGINKVTPTVEMDILGDIVAGTDNVAYTFGLINTDVANGTMYIGDGNGGGNSTFISVNDNSSSIQYRADLGHSFIGGPSIKFNISNLPQFANNAAALLGGLTSGDLYYTNVAGDGIIKIAL